MPLLIVTLALDTDQPERSTMLNSAVAGAGDALVLARALGELQGQILGQIVPRSVLPDDQAPTPEPESDGTPPA